jgi:AcrR family transcriptional regulator
LLSVPAFSAARHTPLTRAAIVDAAIVLVERQGVAALTMRKLGAELGVEAMALYHHFPNRESLVDAIGQRLLEPLEVLTLAGDWQAAARLLAVALRTIAVARPASFQLVGLNPLDGARSLEPVERLLDTMLVNGLTPAQALASYRATVSYARGYALAEATGFTVDAAGAAGRRRLAELPRDDFPILSGRADELAQLDADSGFTLGLDALLDGLAREWKRDDDH